MKDVLGVPMKRVLSELENWYDWLNTGEGLGDTTHDQIFWALTSGGVKMQGLWRKIDNLPGPSRRKILNQIVMAAEEKSENEYV